MTEPLNLAAALEEVARQREVIAACDREIDGWIVRTVEAEERAEAAEAKVAQVEAFGRDQAKPFADGVPDREGEDVWRGIQAALSDQPKVTSELCGKAVTFWENCALPRHRLDTKCQGRSIFEVTP